MCYSPSITNVTCIVPHPAKRSAFGACGMQKQRRTRRNARSWTSDSRCDSFASRSGNAALLLTCICCGYTFARLCDVQKVAAMFTVTLCTLCPCDALHCFFCCARRANSLCSPCSPFVPSRRRSCARVCVNICVSFPLLKGTCLHAHFTTRARARCPCVSTAPPTRPRATTVFETVSLRLTHLLFNRVY
jgi:hypothetical protein